MLYSDLIIRGQRVILPDRISAASIHISRGQIAVIDSYDYIAGSTMLVEVPDEYVVMPGLVDTHVHINSPGREKWEGFETATQAAAAGGVTTLVDMPLNSIPPTTTLKGLQEKLSVARKSCHVDVGFWGGLIPDNIEDLQDLWNGGVVGFKCFLVPSGVDEFPSVGETELRRALPLLASWDAPLIVHAEIPGPIDAASTATHQVDPTSYNTFLRSRPRASENDAVTMLIRLSREFNARIHIVHLSSSDVLPLLRDAQRSGVRITAETCPHYLHFASEQIISGATEFKCCPPIREEANRELLWGGVADGTISTVVSDHSPCPGEMKARESGDFMKAWGGISSLQLRLAVIWTEACRRGFPPVDVVHWLASGPAQQVGFTAKGSIQVGGDADVVIFDPDEEFRVTANQLRHRHQLTPYEGEVLHGVVKKTFLRGQKIYDGGQLEPQRLGQTLLRT